MPYVRTKVSTGEKQILIPSKIKGQERWRPLGITASQPWIETMNPSYYHPPRATTVSTPALVLPSAPTEPLPPGGHFEIQSGSWKVVLTKDEAAAGAEVSVIDKIKAWLAQETIVAGYANQWFVVGGALAYFLFRKK